jgi:hypothetical protein
VIDGIQAADISDAQKQQLLERIQKEGGVSDALRQELITLFDAQVDLETRFFGDRTTLLTTQEQEPASSRPAHMSADEVQVVEDIARRQRDLAQRFAEMIAAMQGDVRTQALSAARTEEGNARTQEEAEIDRIRRGLQGN